jgi:diguanylate cyclase (GGDEF)-like protein
VELHGPAELHFDRAVADRLLHDDLTGLLSRRRFELELELGLEAAAKDRTPLALVLLDLDGLKRVNDAHGHAAGAQVISLVGQHLRALVADAGARGCRFGGDEFAILVAEDEAGAARRAAEWLQAIAAVAVPWGETHLSVAASGGVATPAHEPTTVTELFARADEALLAAKRAGGAQVVRWTELPRKS